MLGIQQERWSDLKAGTLAAGTRLGTIEPLFPRIEKTVEELRSMTGNESPDGGTAARIPAEETPAPSPSPASAAAPVPDNRIGIDDFMKVELRVAKILEAEAVPKSKKLIKMKVNAGEADPRTILAGIAEAYQPEQLVGRTIVIVANLKPAKLMGIESNGMVLAASPEGGLPTLISVDESLPPGARVR
jgi:methionyl-tRNA synthetase